MKSYIGLYLYLWTANVNDSEVLKRVDEVQRITNAT